MGKITFIAADGRSFEGEVNRGYAAMEAAVKLGVPGIRAECGGAAACATCHVHVDPAWLGKTGPATAQEVDLLSFARQVDDSSRLSCQIIMRDALDGLVLHVVEGN